MSVLITDECIICDACALECPVAAILDDSNEKNLNDSKYYVKPETCVECVGHADLPRCAEACPTEGAIVWDMPYTTDYEEYYIAGQEEGKYNIRVHKKKGMMLPSVKSKPFRDDISIEDREAHMNVGQF
ncbi:MAG TPA: 4Fe-4S dicluster domain-containing protein [Campylobacterales bacterium]|nr:4Fe-4S dicluster domain-containing protein [Campylobacterales bacterium]HHC11329.1 4Fe-4S dicluster domain-containing protein [Campylobacterales bacterium]HHD81554.1 4Fe-4S dicluster domain-containing protein [Campylobacterales bacterium]